MLRTHHKFLDVGDSNAAADSNDVEEFVMGSLWIGLPFPTVIRWTYVFDAVCSIQVAN